MYRLCTTIVRWFFTQGELEDIVFTEISKALNTSVYMIDPKLSFLQNGGDSSASMRVQAGLTRQGLWVALEAIFVAQSLLQIVDRVIVFQKENSDDFFRQADTKRARKPSICMERMLTQRQSRDRATPRHVDHRLGIRQVPVTDMQRSLMDSTKANAERNIITYKERRRPENLAAFKSAWRTVLESESIFRMRFVTEGTAIFMSEDAQAEFLCHEVLVPDRQSYILEIEQPPETGNPLDFTMKLVTLQTKDEPTEATVVYRVHHALIDGFAFDAVLSKIEALLSGKKTYEPGPSYIDFAVQLKLLQDRGAPSAINFWKLQARSFSSAATQLLLPAPTEFEAQSTALERFDFQVLHSKLEMSARDAQVTVASIYSAAWGMALATYMGSDVICFGAVLSGRDLAIEDIGAVIGPTINTLPLFMRLRSQESCANYVKETFASLLDLSTYQWSTPAHGFERNFASAISVRLEENHPAGQAQGVVLSDIPIHLEIRSLGRISLTYHGDAFVKSHMELLGKSYVAALEAVQNPNWSIAQCLEHCIKDVHVGKLDELGNWSGPCSRIDSVEDSLVSMFATVARGNPSAIAVEEGLGTITYSDLDQRSSSVAEGLLARISPGDVVSIDADRTTNWIVAIWGVLKAGATYLPLDCTMPDDVRNDNHIAARSKLFLTGSAATKSRKPTSCSLAISVEDLLFEQPGIAGDIDHSRPESGAYICFTSGSSGLPKGVLCHHRGLVAFQRDFHVRLGAQPGWRIAQNMSPAFDGSIHEIFSALTYGSTLVLQDATQPFHHLNHVNSAILTPSLATMLEPGEYPNLSVVYLVGEAVQQRLCDRWSERRQLFNMYGPTEATCGATIKELTNNKPVSIGHPVSSTRIYILDHKQSLLPFGAVGEIYLAGVQVSNGYINRPNVTSKQFFADHINPHFEDEVMYKTGDLAFWNQDGELSLLGRSDRQIKLRGFRIDLDDLEIRLTKIAKSCTSARVTMQENDLIAFVQPAGLDLAALKESMGRHLPSYMIPRQIDAVDAFPLTPVGKIDYNAIRQYNGTSTDHDQLDVTPLKRIIAACLESVLSPSLKTALSIEARYDCIKATSILLIAFSDRLSQLLGCKVSLRILFDSQSIEDLIDALRSIRNVQESEAVHDCSALGEYDVSAMEKDWWLRYEAHSGTSSFNVSHLVELDQSINLHRLSSAWDSVLQRHRILNSRYVVSSPGNISREYGARPLAVQHLDHIDVDYEINIPFNLAIDGLIRVLISRTEMLVVASHIVCDLTALQQLYREVHSIYHGSSLPPVSRTYFQHSWSSPAQKSQRSFWSQYLHNLPHTSFSIGKNTRKTTWNGSSHMTIVPPHLYRAMLDWSAVKRVTMHQLALAATALTLQYKQPVCDLILGAPYLNRTLREAKSVVGLFLEPLPIRIRHPLTRQFGPLADGSYEQQSYIKSVQQSAQAALSHAMPWDQLLSSLNIKRHYPDHPVFDIMVTYHEPESELIFPIHQSKSRTTWSKGSKFKLMAEFTETQEGALSLRLEYSDECFTMKDAQRISKILLVVLQGLTADMDHIDIVSMLRSVDVR